MSQTRKMTNRIAEIENRPIARVLNAMERLGKIISSTTASANKAKKTMKSLKSINLGSKLYSNSVLLYKIEQKFTGHL